MTNRGTIVNLYQISKMIDEPDLMKVKMMLRESYKSDQHWYREYRNLSFIEYINAKRNFVASIMGYREYL